MAGGAQITNPAGVWGETTQALGQGDGIVSAVAATAITAKTVVALSTTEANIVPAATNQATDSIVGIAIEAASSGNPCLVCTSGPVYGVAKSTAAADNIAQFDRLTISSTTTAAVALLASTTAVTQIKDIGSVVGIAMAAATTGATTVDVWVVRW